MRVLGIMFVILYFIFLFFGNLQINGNTKLTLWQRAVLSVFGSAVLTIIIGLPVFGLLSLFGIV